MTDISTAPPLTQGPLVYTTKTLADAIGRSTQYVRNDIRLGFLTGSRSGQYGSWSFRRDEVERYVDWIADGRPGSDRGEA